MVTQPGSNKPSIKAEYAELARITSPSDLGWISALTLFVLAMLGWAFFGKIPEVVQGRGLLIGPGNIRRVHSEGSGYVSKILVANGSKVSRNQPLISLDIAEQELIASERLELLQQLTNSYGQITKDFAGLIRLKDKDLVAELASLSSQLSLSVAQADALGAYAKGLSRLAQQGAISKQAILTAEQNYAAQLEKVESLRSRIRSAAEQQQEITITDRRDYLLRQMDYLQRKADATIDVGRFKRASQVLAPAAGHLYGRVVQVGDYVNAGQVLGSVVLDIREGMSMMAEVAGGSGGKPMEVPTYAPDTALLYFKSDASSILSPGNTLTLTPDGYTREEYGGIKGKLLSISALPSSREDLIAATGSELLADQLVSNQLTYAGVARLDIDARSQSGYRWSGGSGPRRPVLFGTPLSVQAITRYRAPISYVLPFFREWTGLFRL